MLTKRILLLTALLAVAWSSLQAQLVNAYAQVNSITGGGTVLNLGSVEETWDTFENGEFVIVIQMLGASITGGTGSTFGNITDINNAGIFEIGVIASHTASSITLTTPLNNTYNTTSGGVQVVSYPTLGGGGDFTTTTQLRARKWSGVIGGVIAFNVSGNLYAAHNIIADSMGFDYGDKAGTAASTECWYSALWVAADGSIHASYKGGGLKVPSTTQMCGRAAIANGGGGGVGHNGGGGGGSNFTGGGDGDPGTCSALFGGGGQGGYGLSAYIPADSIYRIFMGGGGGGGHQNNDKGSRGGYGGGIVILEADSIFSDCSGSVRISANGSNGLSKKNDGQGGGGAGGSIILYTEYVGGEAGCPLTVQANGGDGGSVNHDDDHGGGGGGGQGFIYIEAEETDLMPMTYLAVETENGEGGLNCYTCSAAEDGLGADDIGIFFGEAPILSAEVLQLEASYISTGAVLLNWVSTSSLEAERYLIYRSDNGVDWEVLGELSSGVTGGGTYTYTFADYLPLAGWNYYKLKQIHVGGGTAFSRTVSVKTQSAVTSWQVYPNPVSLGGWVTITSTQDLTDARCVLYSLMGEVAQTDPVWNGTHQLQWQVPVLAKGYYVLYIEPRGGVPFFESLLVE